MDMKYEFEAGYNTSSLLKQITRNETWLTNITEITL